MVIIIFYCGYFFFFKQKTAYEVRISYWSSDVCSSDLLGAAHVLADGDIFHLGRDDAAPGIVHLADVHAGPGAQGALDDIGEGLDTARAVRPGKAVVLGPDRAALIFLHIAARHDPVEIGRAHV